MISERPDIVALAFHAFAPRDLVPREFPDASRNGATALNGAHVHVHLHAWSLEIFALDADGACERFAALVRCFVANLHFKEDAITATVIDI